MQKELFEITVPVVAKIEAENWHIAVGQLFADLDAKGITYQNWKVKASKIAA